MGLVRDYIPPTLWIFIPQFDGCVENFSMFHWILKINIETYN